EGGGSELTAPPYPYLSGVATRLKYWARQVPSRRTRQTKDRIAWIVADAPYLPVRPLVYPSHLVRVERPPADPAEATDRIAAGVDGAVAIQSTAHRVRVAAVWDRERRDQLRRRLRAEALIARRLRRRELYHTHAVLAVGEIGEFADIGYP